MADPRTYRPAAGSIPDEPGVYRFRDEHRRVVYVGKAKSLRSRLTSYFADPASLHPRTFAMVTTASSVEWTVVATEVEALQLEYSWIKEFDPRFNVRYRDDKSYPYLAVTMGEEFPRVTVMRGAKRKGTRYFGPYAHAWAIRETVDLMLRVFPVRTCSAGVFTRAGQVDRPCLLGYIGKCSAPCVGRVDAEQHRALAEDFVAFLDGRTQTYVRRLETQMHQAAEELEFERAARIRDDLGALKRVLEKNAVVLGDGTDADVVALATDPLEVAVQVFHVRGGRIRGQRGWVADRTDDAGPGDLVERFLTQLYDGDDGEAVPREVLVPDLPDDADALAAWLRAKRGGRVDVRVPQRGDKRDLLAVVARNASETLVQHKTRRAGDLSTRSQALEEIQRALDLPSAPLRIECIDISNLQATEVVASLVVFEDGLARKAEYRHFRVRGTDGAGDTGAVREVVLRRFRKYLEEREQSAQPEWGAAGWDDLAPEAGPPEAGPPEAGQPDARPVPARRAAAQSERRAFAYPPGLLLVDGGAPQVAAARAALDELGIGDVPVAGLAKRLEEVWVPDDPHPVILPRTSEGLYLLQRIRDEAHRFAITFHRQRRSSSMIVSDLDGIPGLGAKRKAAVLAHFGTVRKLRAADVDDVAAVAGVGRALAETIVTTLAARRPGPAVSTATGQIISHDEGSSDPQAGSDRT